MSRRTLIVALLPTLLLGVVCTYLYGEMQRERARAREESELRNELQGRIANLDATRAQLERELGRLRKRSTDPGPIDEPRVVNDAHVVTAPAGALVMSHANASDANGVSAGLSAAQLAWMQSPIARDLQKSHQRDWIRRSSDDLLELLELSPEQTEALIALMADAQTPAFELGATRPIDPATLEKARNKMREQQRNTEQAIEELLGEEKYRTYQDYRNSAMERTQVAELQRLFEATPTPLRDEQSAQLLAALIEERETVPPWTRERTTPTPEQLQHYQQWTEEYQLRVQERIASLLSPGQLERYTAFRQMQEAMRHDAIPESVAIYDGIAFSSSAVAVPD